MIKMSISGTRLALAGMTAAAGGAVSVVMVLWGGPMARHLPSGEGFHLAAVLGAGLAGLVCADGFGRKGRHGWAVAGAVSVVATLLGAALGSTLMGLTAGTIMGWALGVIAILDAAGSIVAALLWAAIMATLHVAALKLRSDRWQVSP